MSGSSIGNDPEFASAPFDLGDWRVDPSSRRISNDEGGVRRVTPKALTVLLVLVNARGAVVPREALLHAVWRDAEVLEENLTHAVAELRRALGDQRRKAKVIETVHGVGYRLTIPARKVDLHAAAARTTTFNLDAYRLCLEAWMTNDRNAQDGPDRTLALCEEAIEIAPHFALPHAAYAMAAVVKRLYYGGSERPSLALEAAMRAADLEPTCSYAQIALGYAQSAMERHQLAWRAFEAALSRSPDNFIAHYLGARALFAAGDMMSAAALAEQASNLRPDDYRALHVAASAYAELGDRRRERAAAMRGLNRVNLRLAEDPIERRARNIRAALLARIGRHEDAVHAVGEDERAGDTLEFYHVSALALADEIPDAVVRLEALLDRGWRHPGWLRFGPATPRLRGDPRFRKMEAVLMEAS